MRAKLILSASLSCESEGGRSLRCFGAWAPHTTDAEPLLAPAADAVGTIDAATDGPLKVACEQRVQACLAGLGAGCSTGSTATLRDVQAACRGVEAPPALRPALEAELIRQARARRTQ